MLRILTFFLFTNCFISTLSLTCGDNEVVANCPGPYLSDSCPKKDGERQIYPQPDPCPEPACRCRFNYRRAANDTCIPTTECPAFDCPKPNEVYNPCPPMCPTDDCSQASPTGECPPLGRIGIVLVCEPSCRCKKGYWKNNGICVPYNQCPGVSQ